MHHQGTLGKHQRRWSPCRGTRRGQRIGHHGTPRILSVKFGLGLGYGIFGLGAQASWASGLGLQDVGLGRGIAGQDLSEVDA